MLQELSKQDMLIETTTYIHAKFNTQECREKTVKMDILNTCMLHFNET